MIEGNVGGMWSVEVSKNEYLLDSLKLFGV